MESKLFRVHLIMFNFGKIFIETGYTIGAVLKHPCQFSSQAHSLRSDPIIFFSRTFTSMKS